GGAASYVDLSLFQTLAGLRYAFPRAMERVSPTIPRLIALADRVAARPRLAASLASPRRVPFNEPGIFRPYPALHLSRSLARTPLGCAAVRELAGTEERRRAEAAVRQAVAHPRVRAREAIHRASLAGVGVRVHVRTRRRVVHRRVGTCHARARAGRSA